MIGLPSYLKIKDREVLEKFRYIQHQEDGRIREATLDPCNSRWSFGVSVMEENYKRNRYVNIMPYERNRVKLNVVEGNDYINASYVKLDVPKQSVQPGLYIATQGPTKNTYEQFWQMCFQNSSNSEDIVVVMVTPLVEQGREKCHQYWPMGGSKDTIRCINAIQQPGGSQDTSRFITALEIEFVSSERFHDCYTLTTMKLRSLNTNGEAASEKTVHHFYFDQWQDMTKPEEIIPIMQLCEHSHRLNSPGTPIVVHCSAGVGRSGTFISLDHLIHDTVDFQRQDNQKLHAMSDYHHDLVEQVVLQLRSQRLKMVQMVDQYRFIYNAAKYLYEHPK